MNTLKKNCSSTYLFAIASFLLITLNFLRIINVPLTHDEAFTYLHYVSKTWDDIINCNPPTANDHFLNSILTRWIINIFNNSVFFLRLANLLAQAIYLLTSSLLVQLLFKNKWWQFYSFIFLNINPFLFNFWGLCRGYGLSLSMMIGSVYFLIKYLENKKDSYLVITLLFSIGAVYSNLTLLNYFLSVAGILLVSPLLFFKEKKWRLFIKHFILLVVSGIIINWLIAEAVNKMIAAAQFYYGGTNDIVSDTIRSLINESLFAKTADNMGTLILSYIVLLTIIVAGYYWINKWIKERHKPDTLIGLTTWLLLIIPLLSELVQHWLLHSKFLIDRTALFLLPLYMLMLIYWLYNIKNKGKYFAAAFSLFLIINFVINENICEARTWEYDKYDTTVLNKIVNEQKGKYKKIRLRVFWLFAPSMEYYTSTIYKDHFYRVEDNRQPITLDTVYDYYYIKIGDVTQLSGKYEIDTSFFYGDYVLMKRKKL